MQNYPSELNPPPRRLMGPGPVDVDPRVLRAMSMPMLDLSPSAPRYVRYEYWVDELPFEVKDVKGGYEVTNLGDKNLHVSLLWSGKNRPLLQTVTVPPGETSDLIRGRRQSESHRTGDHPLEDYQWQRVADWRGKSPRAVSGCAGSVRRTA